MTRIVRAWEAGSLSNLGFVLRITSEDPAEGQGPIGFEAMTFTAPKDATLVYHIQAVRPPGDDRTPPREKETSGKTPRGEDGAGRP